MKKKNKRELFQRHRMAADIHKTNANKTID